MLQVALGFGVSALAVYFLLRQVPLDQLAQALTAAQLVPIVLIVVFVLGSLVTRAARWQILFLPDQHIPFRRLTAVLAISYMASTFLPLRAGELVRPVFLGQRDGVTMPRVLGTILLEKLFDFLAIGAMLVLLIAIAPLPDAARAAGLSIATVILAGFGFVIGLALWRAPTLRLVGMIERAIPFRLGHKLRLEQMTRQFAEGTDALRVPRLWALLLAWTVVTWTFSLASGWAGIASLNVQPTLPSVLLLTVLTSTGQAVPSSPGYVGVYHAAATAALVAFGVDPISALAIAVITHAFTYGSMVVAGLIALWTGGYTFADVLSSVRGQRRTASSGAIASDPWPLAPDP